MSTHPSFDAAASAIQTLHPAVLSFKGLHPKDLGKFAMHDKRRGGDLSHIDPRLSAMNEVLHGGPQWIDSVREKIRAAGATNHKEHIAALKAKSRHREAAEVEAAGPRDPWRSCKGGPMREGLLTVNKAWFGGTGQSLWDPERVKAFTRTALTFLRAHFPVDQLCYASAHRDEEAFHIHFVVLVWTVRTTLNRGRQILLQASANPLLARYEHAQDLVGAAFHHLGIRRGEPRAEQRRAARAAGRPAPEPRRHVPPSQYRQAEIAEGRAEAQRHVAAAEETAAGIVDAARRSAAELARDGDEAQRRLAATLAQIGRLKSERGAQHAALLHLRKSADVERDRAAVAKEYANQAVKRCRLANAAAREAEVKAEGIVENLTLGLRLFAEGMFTFLDSETGSNLRLVWTARARDLPQQHRNEARLNPVLPLLKRFADTVSAALEAMVGKERHTIADDAAFLANLRDSLNPDQIARLTRIAAARDMDGPGF